MKSVKNFVKIFPLWLAVYNWIYFSGQNIVWPRLTKLTVTFQCTKTVGSPCTKTPMCPQIYLNLQICQFTQDPALLICIMLLWMPKMSFVLLVSLIEFIIYQLEQNCNKKSAADQHSLLLCWACLNGVPVGQANTTENKEGFLVRIWFLFEIVL